MLALQLSSLISFCYFAGVVLHLHTLRGYELSTFACLRTRAAWQASEYAPHTHAHAHIDSTCTRTHTALCITCTRSHAFTCTHICTRMFTPHTHVYTHTCMYMCVCSNQVFQTLRPPPHLWDLSTLRSVWFKWCSTFFFGCSPHLTG